MGLEINIKPEDVEIYVKEALIKSGIGKSISEGVSASLRGYDSPVEKAIKKYVGEIAESLIRDKYSEQIKQLVQEKIATMVTDDLLKTIADKTIDTMIRAVERY